MIAPKASHSVLLNWRSSGGLAIAENVVRSQRTWEIDLRSVKMGVRNVGMGRRRVERDRRRKRVEYKLC